MAVCSICLIWVYIDIDRLLECDLHLSHLTANASLSYGDEGLLKVSRR